MPPRAMRAGAVWYRYATGYCSVSLTSTVGADVGIGPYGYEPTNTNFRDSLWSRGPKDVTGLTESVTHWLRALPAKFQFVCLQGWGKAPEKVRGLFLHPANLRIGCGETLAAAILWFILKRRDYLVSTVTPFSA